MRIELKLLGFTSVRDWNNLLDQLGVDWCPKIYIERITVHTQKIDVIMKQGHHKYKDTVLLFE